MNTATSDNATPSRRKSNRRRRASAERKPRTYYAKDETGTTLFRFANYKAREYAIEHEKLIEVQAADSRIMLLELPNLKVVVRDDAAPEEPPVVPETAKESAGKPATIGFSKEAYAEFGEAFWNVLQPRFEKLIDEKLGAQRGGKGGYRPAASH